MPYLALRQLLKKTIRSASPLIRARGRYLPYETISLAIENGDEVEATVQGTRRYEVRIGPFGEGPSCECPYFMQYDKTCKHLVAVAEAALRQLEGQEKSPLSAKPRQALPGQSLLNQLDSFTRKPIAIKPAASSYTDIRYTFRLARDCDLERWSLVPFSKGQETSFSNLRHKRQVRLDPVDEAILQQIPYTYSRTAEQPRSLSLALLLMQSKGSLCQAQSGLAMTIDLVPRKPFLMLKAREAGGARLMPGLWVEEEWHECPEARIFGKEPHVLVDNAHLFILDCAEWPDEKLPLLCKSHELGPAELSQGLPLLMRLPGLVTLDREMKIPAVEGIPRGVLRLSLQTEPPALEVRLRFAYEGLTEPLPPGDESPVLSVDAKGRLYYLRRHAQKERNYADFLHSLMENEEWSLQLEQDRLCLDMKDTGTFLDRVANALKANPDWVLEGLAEIDRLRVRKPRISLQVSAGIDWFDVEGELDYEGQRMTLQNLLDMDGLEMELPDGSRGLVPVRLRKLMRIARGLQEKGEKGLRISRLHLGILESLLEDEDWIIEKRQTLKKQLQAKALRPIPARDVPAQLRATLRSYQEEGLHWLRQMRAWGTGGILADDMGLGKTVQVIAVLCDFYAQAREKRPSLVVMPTSLVHNWQHELKRFAPDLPVIVHHGLERAPLVACELPPRAVILTSYALLRNEIECWSSLPLGYAILDESQAVKNPASQNLSCARQLQAAHRLALTGTPIENNLMDLWSQFAFATPGLLGGRDFFQREFAKPVAQEAPEATEQLSRLIAPFYMRRTKEKVLKDLPSLEERVLYVEMGEGQRLLYERTKKQYRQKILAGIEKQGLRRSQMHILEGMLRLRQIACDPRLYLKSSKASSAKLDLLVEKLQEDVIENHKALVFSQFTSLLDLCGKALKAARIDYAYLDGSTRNRGAVIEAFASDSDKKVFLISLKAGGAGLNLTAADYVFHLDPWWNPAVEAQATGRAHRIGQKKAVQSIKLVASGSIEEKILELQDSKRRLAAQVISSDQGLIQSLDLELVKDLFK